MTTSAHTAKQISFILHSFRLEADCGLQFVKAVCDMMTEKLNCKFCINIVSRINTSETSWHRTHICSSVTVLHKINRFLKWEWWAKVSECCYRHWPTCGYPPCSACILFFVYFLRKVQTANSTNTTASCSVKLNSMNGLYGKNCTPYFIMFFVWLQWEWSAT